MGTEQVHPRVSKISEEVRVTEREYLGKLLAGTGTSTGFQRSLKNSGLRKRNILENSGLVNRDTNRVT
jgi:hypothetical protein